MKFSPLTEKTFDFFESCSHEKLRPIFVAVPSKKNFGISLCARLLQKFWMEDLYNQPNPFKSGDIIKITIPKSINGTRSNINIKAKVISTELPVVKLKFSENNINCVSRNINHLNQYATVDNSSENLSKYKVFTQQLKKLIDSDVENNPWSKYLGVDYPVPISKLSSKVYFIVGRGNVEDSREFIHSMGLEDTFNNSLIVAESLRDFADNIRNDQEVQAEINYFTKAFNNIFDNNFEREEDELNEKLHSIREELSSNDINMAEFRPLLDQFIEELDIKDYSDKHQSLINIITQFLPNLPSNKFDVSLVKCVLINGSELTASYSNTIRALISLKIPVIILSDYANYTKERKEIIKNLFRDFPDTFRLNWNKTKVHALEQLPLNSNYLDKEAYKLCRKYLNQKVIIKAFDDKTKIIDKFFYAIEIRGLLRKLDGFEGVKNAYTVNLRPVLYRIKNIPGQISISNDIIKSVRRFKQSYEQIRDQLNSKVPDIILLFDNFLELFDAESGLLNNSKTIYKVPNRYKYFNQIYYKLYFNELPLKVDDYRDSYGLSFLFTGTPYEEVKYYYLRRTIFNDFYDVYYLGFCKEAENVFKYFLNDTLSFNRNITDIMPGRYTPFWDSKLNLETEVVFLNELCSDFNYEADPQNENINFDETQEFIEYFRYQNDETDKLSDDNIDTDTKVAVNILELDGNKTIFVKKSGARRLLVLKNNIFDKTDWDDIHPGDRVFTYTITRQNTLEMRGENTINESVFYDLDIWYEKLKILLEYYDFNILELANKLNVIKVELNLPNSNPNPANLRNWLRDDRLINAPEKENLILILSATETANVNDVFKKIMNAKQKVEILDRRNREKIKIQIQKHINNYDIEESDSFNVTLNGISINVKHGIVKHKMEPGNFKVEQDKINLIIDN